MQDNRDRNKAIRELVESGKTLRDAGRAFSLSSTRIAEITRQTPEAFDRYCRIVEMQKRLERTVYPREPLIKDIHKCLVLMRAAKLTCAWLEDAENGDSTNMPV